MLANSNTLAKFFNAIELMNILHRPIHNILITDEIIRCAQVVIHARMALPWFKEPVKTLMALAAGALPRTPPAFKEQSSKVLVTSMLLMH